MIKRTGIRCQLKKLRRIPVLCYRMKFPGIGEALRKQINDRILKLLLMKYHPPLNLFHRLKMQRRTGRVELALLVRTVKDRCRAICTADDPHDHGTRGGYGLAGGGRGLPGPVAIVTVKTPSGSSGVTV